ncbi:DUF2793 domain-containing protein [Marinibacterium sp. SX1]|uniref:DUF2793 domain-containing protein n=1 Tax=Marinibacterium sp. SX1 TaxID=3388424 RepID=UPI003D185F7B
MSDSSQSSPVLSLPYIQPSQAQKHVTHNTALARLDLLVQAVAADRDRVEPPETVAAGAVHLVAAGGQGDWAGQDLAIAAHDGTGWVFVAPKPGWRVHVLAEAADVIFDGSAWALAQAGLDGLDELGIGTAADAANPLAVAGPGTLLTHGGAGHQLRINKAGPADTASLLFQTGWSGRAEMGTTGSDDFAIKVSPDGSAWTTALSLDASAGTIGGAAVQQGPTDTTPGRLARADHAYGPGNLLGPVSDSGGIPTGAVIERGSAGGGRYVRWADGTQICTAQLTLSQATGGRLEASWTYPLPFIGSGDLCFSLALDAADFSANVSGPGLDEALAPCVLGISATDVVIRLYRVAGGTDFAATDTAACRVLVFGRWS